MPEKIGDFIVCPYCNSTHPDMCDYPDGLASGEEREMNCWECGQLFVVTCEVSYTFYVNEKRKPTEKEEIDAKAKEMIRDSRLGREDLE